MELPQTPNPTPETPNPKPQTPSTQALQPLHRSPKPLTLTRNHAQAAATATRADDAGGGGDELTYTDVFDYSSEDDVVQPMEPGHFAVGEVTWERDGEEYAKVPQNLDATNLLLALKP
jgi:hypothetical protein